MRKLVVTNIISLDAYYEGPDGHPMGLPMDAAFDAYNLERMRAADFVLLGRASYQMFSSYWPAIADAAEDPGNPGLSDDNREFSRLYNKIPKVVVSDTYTPDPGSAWHDTTSVVSRAEVSRWIRDRKQEEGGDIVMFGSRTTWNGLLGDSLVDEVHAIVGAVLLRGGTPVFDRSPDTLRMIEARRFDNSDNVLLRYAVHST